MRRVGRHRARPAYHADGSPGKRLGGDTTKDAYYFPHDCNARNDYKIKAMRSKYGADGYGRYWILVEMMREQSDYRLPFSDKYSAAIYADEFKCSPEEATRFMHDCVEEFGLFESDGEYFWSSSFLRRMEEIDERRDALSRAGRKGGINSAQARLNQGSTKAQAVKESKVKKIKDISTGSAGAGTVAKDKEQGTQAKRCLDYYFEKHKERRGFEPIIDGGRDMAIFKRILQSGYTVDAISQVIDFFFAYKQRSRFTTRALYSSFDTLYGVLKDKAEGRR